jgi:hypothetical protein
MSPHLRRGPVAEKLPDDCAVIGGHGQRRHECARRLGRQHAELWGTQRMTRSISLCGLCRGACVALLGGGSAVECGQRVVALGVVLLLLRRVAAREERRKDLAFAHDGAAPQCVHALRLEVTTSHGPALYSDAATTRLFTAASPSLSSFPSSHPKGSNRYYSVSDLITTTKSTWFDSIACSRLSMHRWQCLRVACRGGFCLHKVSVALCERLR